MNDTVDPFSLRQHFLCSTEVTSAELEYAQGEKKGRRIWAVQTRNTLDGCSRSFRARILVSAVGALSSPKGMVLPGLDTFSGKYWHSAKWHTTFHWKGKAIAVIGNGCSATQIIPDLLETGVGSIVQLGRSAH